MQNIIKNIAAGALLVGAIGLSAQSPSAARPDFRTIELVNLKDINSTFLDFSAMPWGSGIVFTSNRGKDVANKYDVLENIWCTDLYKAEKQGFGVFGLPQLLTGDVNTEKHEGVVTFSADQKTMYFSRNRISGQNKEGVLEMNMYEATFADGNWRLSNTFPFNSPDYTTCHPALDPANNRLYFASNRPGGLGGMDIWYSVRQNGSWATPVNAGPMVNTAENELFPFVAADGALYFSSKGHAGYGKLDVFCAVPAGNGEWKKAENLGSQINSVGDDFGFTIQADQQGGYLSSNRADGTNDDIYEWRVGTDVFKNTVSPEAPKPAMARLTGTVKHAKYGTAIPNALVTVYEKCTGEYRKVLTDANGAFSMDTPCNCEVEVVATKEKFNEKMQSYSTVGNCEALENQVVSLALDNETVVPAPTPAPAPKREYYVGRVFELPNIHYDYDKWFIRTDAASELDHVVQVMNEHPTMTIMLTSHTDSRGNDAYNMELSNKRAAAAREYIVSKGIAGSRIQAEGRGESQPVNQCTNGVSCSEQAHQANRRTEVQVLSIKE